MGWQQHYQAALRYFQSAASRAHHAEALRAFEAVMPCCAGGDGPSDALMRWRAGRKGGRTSGALRVAPGWVAEGLAALTHFRLVDGHATSSAALKHPFSRHVLQEEWVVRLAGEAGGSAGAGSARMR